MPTTAITAKGIPDSRPFCLVCEGGEREGEEGGERGSEEGGRSWNRKGGGREERVGGVVSYGEW